MIGYPFDSEVTYDEHGNPTWDRAVPSAPLRNLIKKLFTTGVMPNPSDNLQVTAGVEGMTTIVNEGFCVIEGGLKLEDEGKTMMHQAADATYDRIDTVVMRWNDNVNARICSLYVLTGVPSATPVRPELTREGAIYEIGLADVLIKANSTTISQQRITDTRYDAERCGVIRSIAEYDTTYIYDQVQADLAGFKADEEASFAQFVTQMTARITDYENSNEEEFTKWFETIRGILGKDEAGRLQNEIDELTETEFEHYHGLVAGTTEIETVNGVTNIDLTSSWGTSHTEIKTVAGVTTITETIAPTSGTWKYVKTTTIQTVNGVTTIKDSYTKEAKTNE